MYLLLSSYTKNLDLSNKYSQKLDLTFPNYMCGTESRLAIQSYCFLARADIYFLNSTFLNIKCILQEIKFVQNKLVTIVYIFNYKNKGLYVKIKIKSG